MASSEGGVISGLSWISRTKPFLRSISKPRAKYSSTSGNTVEPGVADQPPQMRHDHEIDTDGGTLQLLDVADDRDARIKQLVEKSYREHGLKALVRRQLTSELKELGGVNGVAKLLGTDLHTGLGIVTDQEEEKEVILEQLEKELDLRRRSFGTNYINVPEKQSLLWESFKQSFLSDDSISYILTRGCTILLIILGVVADAANSISWAYGPALLVIQFILDAIVLWSAYRLSQLLYNMQALHIRKNVQVVKAIRCGRKRVVFAQDLVVGDLVELKSGDPIPADGLLVEGHGFKIDCPAKDTPVCPHNSGFLTSGCFVHSGLGLMLITAVGEDCKCLLPAESSCSSRVADEEVTRMEPALLHRVRKFNALLQRLKLSISALFMCILLPFYFSGYYSSHPSGKFVRGRTRAIVVIYNLVNEFYGSLTFVTVVIPDTVSQAARNSLRSFLQRMSGQRVSISNLEKCEAKLGFVTTICTGKRNVLTLDRMDVHSFWIAGAQHPSDQILLATQYNPSMTSAMPEDIRELLSEGVALNYTTGYYANKGTDSKIFEDSYESAMEKALLRWGQDILGINFDSVREKCTTSSMELFDPIKMRSGVTIQRRGSNGKCTVVHWKGAVETMLPSCTTTWLRTEAGGRAEIVSLSEEQLQKSIEGIASSMGEKGLSCLALVYCEEALGDTCVRGAAGGNAAGANIELKDGSGEEVPSTSSAHSPEKDITLLALVGMKQALRPEARNAVKKAKDAGIRVIMVTGDSLAAATAIAKESGIIEDRSELDTSDKVVHASAFEAWDASERAKKLEKLAVLARASGVHKLQLVENIQANDGRKEVVAVTGYKLTDGRALKKADVAFSWNSGVQAAYKGSSDVILPDDAGFACLYKAIESARGMRYNIQYYFHFQATLSFATALTTGLTTMQSQWINLITALATIALTMQRPPTSSLLMSGGAPVPPSVDEPLFTSYSMWRNVALQAAYQVILFNWMLVNYEDQDLEETIIFNTLIFCQVINILNARQSLLPKDFLFHIARRLKVLSSLVKTDELLLLAMIVGIAGVQVALIRYLGHILSTVALNWAQWRLCVGLALPTWLIAILGKWL